MTDRGYKHVHFGAGAFGLGFVAALMEGVPSVPTVLVNRSKSEVHLKLKNEREFLLRSHSLGPDPYKTSTIHISDLLFLDEEQDAIRDLVSHPQTILLTTALKGGLEACAPLFRRLLENRAAVHGSTHPLFVVPCENVLGEAFLELAQDPPEGVHILGTVVDRVCNGPTISGQQNKVCVETERYAHWTIESSPATAPLATALKPLIDVGVLTFVDDIVASRKRKLWLVNGVHAACALFALNANEPDLDVFLATPPGQYILHHVQKEMGLVALEGAELEHDEVIAFNASIARRFSTTPDSTSRVLERFQEARVLDFVKNLGPKIVEPVLEYLRSAVNPIAPPMVSHAIFIALSLAAKGRFVSRSDQRVPCA